MSEQDKKFVQNRSEIVFIYDAQNANPNGNPMSSDDSPRKDPQTEQAIVTDVRLKRYLRDQLVDDNYPVYIQDLENENAPTREELAERLVPEEITDLLKSDDLEASGEEIIDNFLENAIDVRLFGAVFSFSSDDSDEIESVTDGFPANLTGPVQFSPAFSLNAPVQENTNFDALTSVIATQEGKKSGGYDLDDKRLKYAIFPFHGIVNENAADSTHLTEKDIKLLDKALWRSIKNQTVTRSKVGQEPRFYVRVEYSQDNFHLGDLHTSVNLAEETKSPKQLRNGSEVVLDLTELVSRLQRHETQLETLYLNWSDVVDYKYDGTILDSDSILEVISTEVDCDIEKVDPYDI